MGLLRRELRTQEKPRHPDDAVEGGSEFMADISQEPALGGGLGLCGALVVEEPRVGLPERLRGVLDAMLKLLFVPRGSRPPVSKLIEHGVKAFGD